jgi:hypothetical protein
MPVDPRSHESLPMKEGCRPGFSIILNTSKMSRGRGVRSASSSVGVRGSCAICNPAVNWNSRYCGAAATLRLRCAWLRPIYSNREDACVGELFVNLDEGNWGESSLFLY